MADFPPSMLDLNEDPRLSITSSDIYDYDDDDDDDTHSASDNADQHLPRMSLGPKMRFHSRAPWEMDESTLQEEDEPDYRSVLPTSRKGFTFSLSRCQDDSRPSGESSRSQEKPKRSFETTSSQMSYPRGAL